MGPLPPVAVTPPRGPLRPEDYLNIRDALSAFVGKKYADTTNADARSIFSYLRGQLGPEAAQQVLLHMQLHNQRPDMARLGPEERVQQFYDIGSRNPIVNEILNRAKMVGFGPVAGMRESPDVNAADLEGKRWYNNNQPLAAPGSLQALQTASASLR